jgi:hypothetical protein
LPDSYCGKWQGILHDGDRTVALSLLIADKESTLRIQGQNAESITDSGLVEAMMVGKARGDLGLPATRAAKADTLSLRLKLRGPKLEGEIGAEAPIPHAKGPEHIPFWAEFSRADARSVPQ